MLGEGLAKLALCFVLGISVENRCVGKTIELEKISGLLCLVLGCNYVRKAETKLGKMW